MIKPKHVILELTEHCNLKCPGCYREFAKHHGGHMDPGLAREIIREVGQLDPRPILVPFSHGETMLYPYLDKALTWAAMAGLQIKFGTNATADLAELVEVAKTPRLELCISLDGLDPDVRRISRPGAEKAAENAASLIHQGYKVSVSYFFWNQPYEDVEAFIHHWLKVGAHQVIIRRPLPQDPLPRPLDGWERCKYHQGYYLTIKSDGRVKLCERNVGSPMIGHMETQSVQRVLERDTILESRGYCQTCPQRYTGRTQYGLIELDGSSYYIRKDYFNTIYSNEDLRYGVAWEDQHDKS
jgi:sulfatase maturation enzyme AslB (radical SAM superfamily)